MTITINKEELRTCTCCLNVTGQTQPQCHGFEVASGTYTVNTGNILNYPIKHKHASRISVKLGCNCTGNLSILFEFLP